MEMVMQIEEKFEVKISDEVAVTLVNPKTVIDYLMNQPEINEKWSRDYVASSVWSIIEDEAGIDRKDYNEDSGFIEDLGMD